MTASITFDDDDNAIAGISFSVDYDQTCLNFDGTGSVEFMVDDFAFLAYALFDSGDTDAEIDINISAMYPGVTVSDGVIVNITFTASDEAGCPGTTAKVGFSSGTTFRNTGWNPVSGWTQDGSVKIADE